MISSKKVISDIKRSSRKNQIWLKYALTSFIVFNLFACFAWSSETQESPITVGFIPGGDPTALREETSQFAQSLQEELGVPVNVYISKNYQGLVEAIKSKKVDFAFLNAVTFVAAEKEAPVKVLLKKVWTEPFYYSAIIVKAESKIHSVDDLKRRKIAFVDGKSGSGYLYPLAMLKEKKIEGAISEKKVFSGNHLNSMKMLESGEVDAAAVFSDDEKGVSGAWTKFAPDLKNPKQKYRIVWISGAIPSDPFCVRQDFYEKNPKLTHTLMFSLIDLAEKKKEDKNWKSLMGSKTLMLATSQQYEPVRKLVKILDLKE